MKTLLRILLLSLSVFLFSSLTNLTNGQATVTTDQPDYAPLSTAIFTGSGFSPNENVVLKVKNLTQPCNTVSADSSYLPWTVIADANGAFVTTWTVCDCNGDSLRLRATGQTSGLIANAYFSDASPWTITVSPSPVCVGVATTFTVRVTSGGNGSGSIGCLKVTVPATFGSLGTPLVTSAPDGISSWNIGLSGNLITATATGQNARLMNGEVLTFTIQATATTATGSPFVWTSIGTDDRLTCVLGANPNPITQPSVSVNALPVVSTTNACIGGGNVTFTQSGGAIGGNWTVSGGGTIVASTGVFSPTTAGCFTATYTTPSPFCTDTKNFVVFPAAPTITAISNSCNAALSNISPVTVVSGFTAEYAVQAPGGSLSAYGTLAAANALLTNTPGCWTIKARYKLTAACGGTGANATSGTVACQEGTINAVVFPAAPSITAISNSCNAALSNISPVAVVSGFTAEYAVQAPGGSLSAYGTLAAANALLTNTPGCWTIKARYKLTAACGGTGANATSGTVACQEGTINAVVFPAAPSIPAMSNSCNAALSNISPVAAVSGFTAEYAVQAPGGSLSAYSDLATANSLLTNTPGCWTIKARYKLTSACGGTGANATSGTVACQEGTVNAVVFPAAPSITATANTCNAMFTLPTVTPKAGFNVEYSIDGGTYAANPSTTTPGCHTVTARYVLAATCGSTLEGDAGPCGPSNSVSIVIFPAAPSITATANTCNAMFTLPTVTPKTGFNVEYSIDGGAYAANPSTTTPGCHTVTARYVLAADCGATLEGDAGPCGPSNSVSIVIFPAAPSIAATANTCNAMFTLPTVTPKTGFNVEYSIDGGAYAANPSTTTPGCHTVTARYVLAADCGATLEGDAGPCGPSNSVSIVIFPAAPSITATANTCNAMFTLPTVTPKTGFNVEYSIDGGTYAANPSTTTPGCHTVTARYVLAADCGSTLEGDAGPCGPSNSVSIVIFPAAPSITATANTCNAMFTLPTVTPKTGFNVEYSIDGGAYAANPSTTTPGCHTVTARYVLAADCGSTLEGDAGPCGPSNSVSIVIFPAAPSITATANTCNAMFTLPTVTPKTGFNVEYSIDGGAYAANPSTTTPGCHTVTARYVLAADCGATLEGDAGPCGPSNSVSIVIFPAAPSITATANTCNAMFTLPTVTPKTGFNVEYSIDGGAYAANPSTTTPGCHTVTARYVLAADCGATLEGDAGPCGPSNSVSIVIFPAAPSITATANTCNAMFTLPTVTPKTGFNVEYSIDGGAYAANPSTTTPGCHTVTARYVLAADCGSTLEGDAGPCGPSNSVSIVIFPAAPSITATANTCNATFTLPTVTPKTGFNVEYSIDGGPYAANPSTTTRGCHTVTARYVLAADCGSTLEGDAGPCGPSNSVSIVIFPAAPSITATANTCNAMFTLPTVTPKTGFNVEYSIDGGAYAANPSTTTPGCHTVTARYVLAADCGATLEGDAGPCGPSNSVSIVIFPAAPSITATANTCNAMFTLPTVTPKTGFNVEYSIDGGAYAANPSTTTPGCHTVTARYVLAADCGATLEGDAGPCGPSNSVSIVIFPAAPSITATANTCNAMFTLPTVTPKTGFNVEYSIDGGAYAANPSTTTPGCHTVTARYVLASDCGSTLEGDEGPCGPSNSVSIVIFPAAPSITATANTCNAMFTLPTVTPKTGFNVEYSIDGGAYAANPSTTTPGCHTVTARYVLAADCGSTLEGDAGPCGPSNSVSIVIFPAAPSITATANTCNAMFTLPTVTPKTGFNVEYSIDGGAYAANPSTTTPGCHTVTARYVLAADCGATLEGDAGPCGPSNSVSIVIFPAAPVITAPANTCASAFTLPTVSAVAGFDLQYSIDGGAFSASPSTTTPGCHTVKARYVLAAACNGTAAGTAGTGSCGESNTVSVVIFPTAPVITAPANTCASAFTLPAVSAVAGFNVQYSIDGGTFSASPGTTTPGCHIVKARYVLAADCNGTAAGTAGTGSCGESNTVSVVIFPTAPVITAPANTCASAFTLPTVSAVAGFNVQYSIDGGAFSASPSTTTPGCHTVKARYVLAAACNGTVAGTAGTGSCGESNTVSVVIFPTAPVITAPANTCASAFTLPTVSAVAGFNVQYSIDAGAFSASPGTTTPGCHTVKARYVLAADCNGTAAGTAGTGSCSESNTVNVVIFPTAPVITAPANTCASAFTLPTVSAVAGFNVQYSIDGGAFSASPGTTTPGCHTVKARYVLAAACNGTAAGTAGTGSCGESNTVSVVIFPTAPVITAPANTCASAFTLPTVSAVAGFNVQYSIDGGAFSASPSATTPGCHTVKARYVLAAACNGTAAGTAGTGSCSESNTVNVVIFPLAPVVSAPTNTCNAAFTLPSVTPVAGFNVQYSIDGAAFSASPSTTTPGCHSIKARYVLAAACNGTAAGTAGTGSCGESNTVNVVIFPLAPPAPTVNGGFGPIIVTPPASVSGFSIEYSFNDGSTWGPNTPPTADNCTGYKIKTRYVTASACGSIPAGTPSIIAACKESPATIRIVDNTPPTISVSVNPTCLWPPNHKMRDITVTPILGDNCGGSSTVTWAITSVTSNEPVNGTGDGNTGPDWIIGNGINGVPVHGLQLRAEREGTGTGRVYTITVTATDAFGNTTTKTATVCVAHNITSPANGNAVKVGSTVNFSGTFWDVPGKTHTAKWDIDGTVVSGTDVEPSGTNNGTVTGSYKFTTPGIYKLQMNVTDQTGITSYANTNGDMEAIAVVYDPNGGYTYGSGSFVSSPGAIPSNSTVTGQVSFGFQSNYYKGATNPKGETEFKFSAGDLTFNALNFDYLVVSGAKAQFKGLGKMTTGLVEQSGIAFILTAIDGQITGGGGVDKIRMKIYNKTTGQVYYDNQPGASDAADPVTPVTSGSCIVIVNTSPLSTSIVRVPIIATTPATAFKVKVLPNPTSYYFNLGLSSASKEKVKITVVDVTGRVIEQKTDVPANSTLQLGDKYHPGIYFAEVIQGKDKIVLKLIKEGK